MLLNNPFKMLPSSYYMPLAIVAGGLLAWRFLATREHNNTANASANVAYDRDLIALGVQTSLERDKLNATTELSKFAMQTEMQGLDRQLTFDEAALKYSTDSAERVKRDELSVMSRLNELTEYTRQHEANVDLQKTIASANAHVASTKAAKKKGFSVGGFSLSF